MPIKTIYTQKKKKIHQSKILNQLKSSHQPVKQSIFLLKNAISYQKRKDNDEKKVTRHNLEALKTPALEVGDGLVGLALPGRAPRLDVVENVDAGGALGPDGAVLVVAEDVAVHGREVDDGDSECAVHVEDDAPQSRLGGGGGHGDVGVVEGGGGTHTSSEGE